MSKKRYKYHDSQLGITQDQRFTSALDPSFVKIDGRNIEQRFKLALKYAHLLKYYNLQNKHDGDWKMLFNPTPLVLLIEITDTQWIQPENDKSLWAEEILQIEDADHKYHCTIQLIKYIQQLLMQLEIWLEKARKLNLEALKHEIESIIEFIANEPLRTLKSYDKGAGTKAGIDQHFGISYAEFDEPWDLQNVSSENIFTGPPDQLHIKLNNAIPSIDKLRIDAMDAMHVLVRFARKSIHNYWQEEASYKPDLGLLISFFRLLDTSTSFLNTIPKRHLDFYYEEVLQEPKLPAVPDSAFVSFEITEESKSFVLPRGTALLAGVFEDGTESIYLTDNEVTLNTIQIASLKTLYVDRWKLKTEKYSFDYIPKILAAPVANSEDGLGREFPNPSATWPTFGAPSFYKGAKLDANIGWAITDPILLLQEGERTIEIQFSFSNAQTTFYDMLTFWQAYFEVESLQIAFNLLFCNAFSIRLTTTDQWIDVSYALNLVKLGTDYTGFTIKILIPTDAPAIVGKAEQSEDFISGYESSYPIVEVMLNNNANWYAYSNLWKLELQNINIQVEVNQLQNLALYNNSGPLDAKLPFYPFGELPIQKSFLLIGSRELFQKKLTALEITLNWLNLPNNETGFKGYYAAYDMGINNNSFQVGWSALSQGKWKPLSQQQPLVELFNSPVEGAHEPDQKLSPTTKFDQFNLNLLGIVPDHNIAYPLEYAAETKAGFLKMELLSPPEGFGVDAYPIKFTETVTKNAELLGTKMDNFAVNFPFDLEGDSGSESPFEPLIKKLEESMKEAGQLPDSTQGIPPTEQESLSGNLGFSDAIIERNEQKPIPNQPYIPYVEKISLYYKASTSLYFNQQGIAEEKTSSSASMYHILPFGQSIVYEQGNVINDTLVPSFPNEGTLYIGLANTNPPDDLSIFFELDSKIIKSTQMIKDIPEVDWKYYSSSGWKSLKPNHLIADGTHDFTQPGIIHFKLPADMINATMEFPGIQSWLQASVGQNSRLLDYTEAVLPQAVKVVWKTEDANATLHLASPLSANSITNLLEEVPQIAEVLQPYPSFGGIIPENQHNYYTRISELLQHKGRGIRTWDYERLVLQAFPFIYQVRLISPLCYPHFVSPGKIILTVISQRTERHKGERPPQIPFNTLRQIKGFIEKKASPFLSVEVANPLFETVQVICSVVFSDDHEIGYYLEKLNMELVNYISPWLDDINRHLNFEEIINVQEVEQFIRGRYYVKAIGGFSMIQIIKKADLFEIKDTAKEDKTLKETITATNPLAVLISASHHEITPVLEINDLPSEPEPRAIGNMMINHDFINFKDDTDD